MTAAAQISVDAAVAAVLSELRDIFTLKEKREEGTEGFFFFQWATLFCFPSIQHRSAERLRGDKAALNSCSNKSDWSA